MGGMDQLIGNNSVKEQIRIAITSAKSRNTAIPHILFSGAAGCGKTSTAMAVATETGVPFLGITPNDLKGPEEVKSVLEKLDCTTYDRFGNRVGEIKPPIIFIDEAHNVPIKGQEILGIAMERFMIESGEPNKYFWIPFFTVIAATTLAGALSKPFRDRFKMTFNFQPYEIDDMVNIIKYHAAKLSMKMTQSAIYEVAMRSRGTPRIGVGYVERVRDAAIATSAAIVTDELVKSCFSRLGIDCEGLTTLERRILKSLSASKTPIGLDNLSIILQEDARSIKGFAEPFLIRKGFVAISGRGRIITEKGRQHINNTDSLVFMKEEIPYDYVRN